VLQGSTWTVVGRGFSPGAWRPEGRPTPGYRLGRTTSVRLRTSTPDRLTLTRIG
jgi:hypothetical protein